MQAGQVLQLDDYEDRRVKFATEPTPEGGEVLETAFNGFDHPMVEHVRDILMGTTKTETGKPFVFTEVMDIEEVLDVVFMVGTAYPEHEHVHWIHHSIQYGKFNVLIRALLPGGKLAIVEQFIANRLECIRIRRLGSCERDLAFCQLYEVCLRLAAFVLLPEDVEKLPPWDAGL